MIKRLINKLFKSEFIEINGVVIARKDEIFTVGVIEDEDGSRIIVTFKDFDREGLSVKCETIEECGDALKRVAKALGL